MQCNNLSEGKEKEKKKETQVFIEFVVDNIRYADLISEWIRILWAILGVYPLESKNIWNKESCYTGAAAAEEE